MLWGRVIRSGFVLTMLVARGLSFQVVCPRHPSAERVTENISTWMMMLRGILKEGKEQHDDDVRGMAIGG